MRSHALKMTVITLLAGVAYLGALSGAVAEPQDSLQKLVSASRAPVKPSASTTNLSYSIQSWMHADVADAWAQGYFGSGTQMTFVDSFKGGTYYGNLGTGTMRLSHGGWTSLEASMIAPQATIVKKDFSDGSSVKLSRTKFNVINLSYGVYARDGIRNLRWGPTESSIIQAAKKGTAVVVKAAGNDGGTAVGKANLSGEKDYLNSGLIGAPAAIFVGALSTNGSVAAPATMASYSNIAGSDTRVQNQFLVVGVEGHKTGLYGTSFAAPIVAGYAAIINSKFTTATPTQVSNRLLSTTRTDTIANYNAQTHGRGEASLSRALAPNTIQ